MHVINETIHIVKCEIDDKLNGIFGPKKKMATFYKFY